MALKKLCNHPGCNTLIEPPARFCGAHIGDAVRSHTWERKESAEWRYLYQTARWRKLSSSFLIENPICVECGNLSECCDHIIPHRGDVDLFWNSANHQALCKQCHDKKTRAEMTEARRNAQPGRGV